MELGTLRYCSDSNDKVSDPAFGGADNYCCTPQFKKTEQLVRNEYGGVLQSTVPDFPPECPCIL